MHAVIKNDTCFYWALKYSSDSTTGRSMVSCHTDLVFFAVWNLTPTSEGRLLPSDSNFVTVF